MQSVSLPGEVYRTNSSNVQVVAARLVSGVAANVTLFDGNVLFVPAAVAGPDRFIHAVRFNAALTACNPPSASAAGSNRSTAGESVSIDLFTALGEGDPDAGGSVEQTGVSVSALTTPLSFFVAAGTQQAGACESDGTDQLIAQLTCSWWDPAALDWTSAGCVKGGSVVTSDMVFVECQCSHLTGMLRRDGSCDVS